jgi:signal transduction histidine kinase
VAWGYLVAAAVGLAVGAAVGAVAIRSRDRRRLNRLREGIAELASGNLAHRVIMPGSDGFSRMADDLNQLADTIQLEREAAAAADEARRRFIANISHDLRTPITSIAGYVDALQRGLGDEPERYLAVIRAKVDELAQLTDDLFYAARLDAGDLKLHLVQFDLAEAVRRSVLGFEPELAALNARVELSIPDKRCLVAADPSAVSRILSNLISNSVRHGESMTAFTVEMTAGERGFIVRLVNDGSSLPGDIERLFDRGVSGPGGGAGLGLSIARELAERMGATVSAKNTGEGGVAFALDFPSLATGTQRRLREFSGS